MKTKSELIKQMNFLINEERKKDLNRKYGKICRYKRIIEIREQKFFFQEYRTEEEEKRYIIIDNNGFDYNGEHYNLEEVKKELNFLNK